MAVDVSIPIVDGVDPAESDEVDAGAEPVDRGGRRRLVAGHGVRVSRLGLDALLLLRLLRLHRLTFSRAASDARSPKLDINCRRSSEAESPISHRNVEHVRPMKFWFYVIYLSYKSFFD